MWYDKIMNEKFVDQDFKPESSSLNITPEKVDRWQHFEWKRATEILMLNKDMEKREIFSGKIDHKSIRQGELGNVYFLSVLSILAEKPHRIRDLFRIPALPQSEQLGWLAHEIPGVSFKKHTIEGCHRWKAARLHVTRFALA